MAIITIPDVTALEAQVTALENVTSNQSALYGEEITITAPAGKTYGSGTTANSFIAIGKDGAGDAKLLDDGDDWVGVAQVISRAAGAGSIVVRMVTLFETAAALDSQALGAAVYATFADAADVLSASLTCNSAAVGIVQAGGQNLQLGSVVAVTVDNHAFVTVPTFAVAG